MAYQVSHEGTIYQNGRVIGRTNDPRRVAQQIRKSNHLNQEREQQAA